MKKRKPAVGAGFVVINYEVIEMTRIIIASLPDGIKSFIKRCVMYAFEIDLICAATAARLVRDWELGSH